MADETVVLQRKKVKKSGSGQKKKGPKKGPKKKKRIKRPGFLAHLIVLAFLIITIYMLTRVYRFDVLPLRYFAALTAVVLLVWLLIDWFWMKKSKRPITRTLCALLCIAISAGYFVGMHYIDLADEMLDSVTNIASVSTSTVTAVVKSESSIESISDLEGKTIALMSESDPEGMARFQNDLAGQVNVNYVEYNTLFESAEAFWNDKVDAIALPEMYRQTLHETGDYYTFQFVTKDVYKVKTQIENTSAQQNIADAVSDITTEPFTVLISGNDSYGELNDVARSDVNMLVTINPTTGTILMTSIPRDSYVDVTCKKDETACVAGGVDKLTHSGIYGTAVTESTIEDMLDIEINYIVRVNFSSLTNLVDALGGIDVYVEDGLAVEQFWTNPTLGVDEGWNHLDGEGALAFSRERYSYVDGDLQRIRNQQIVLKAILSKVLSVDMIWTYPDFMEALMVAFDTNVTSDEIRSLIKMQLIEGVEWEMESYALRGYVTDAWCTALQSTASVTIPYEETITAAKEKIEAVLNGESSTTIADPLEEEESDTSSNSYSYDTSDSYDESGALWGDIYYNSYGQDDDE
jgi:LCP family protein required for cell wall assembly